jgi:hypothetical protein
MELGDDPDNVEEEELATAAWWTERRPGAAPV